MERRYEIAKQFTEQYRRLSPEATKALSLIMEPMKLAKGEVFIKEGDIAHYVHYVEKGLVRQFYYKNKRDLTEHISYEGNVVICLESYLRQEPTRLMAETLEPSIIWRMSKENFYRLTEEMTAPAKKMNVQLYSLRTLLGTPAQFEQNHPYVLSRLVQMGYTGVEPASYEDGLFSGLTPTAFRALFDSYGLEIPSSHTTRPLTRAELASGDITEALQWWDKCIAAHKEAGIPRLIMSYAPKIDNEAGLKVMAEYLNAIGEKCNAAGIRFGYHNHSVELDRVGRTTMLDYLITNTDPAKVFFQLDVYWTVMGGASPVEYMKKYAGRFEMIHIKDKYEIGQSGMVGFEPIFRNFRTAGVQAYVVEMEQASTPNILKGLRESALYLRNAEYVK